jgi:hypothetical protein
MRARTSEWDHQGDALSLSVLPQCIFLLFASLSTSFFSAREGFVALKINDRRDKISGFAINAPRKGLGSEKAWRCSQEKGSKSSCFRCAWHSFQHSCQFPWWSILMSFKYVRVFYMSNSNLWRWMRSKFIFSELEMSRAQWFSPNEKFSMLSLAASRILNLFALVSLFEFHPRARFDFIFLAFKGRKLED